ncbi:DUF642 domain-containing protein [Methylobacillus gramineus]|uniref:PEP-CTERM sorting domain-containing protein n=1 Tax=Methylobacillus gramineus TaxID=755169 RepID=UPI001CFF7BEE|nr:PEP-CTERM sorting domain-containing protein [Methylobacillus gramineus]MCB5184269.1 DUF642 domain-containing protein [Methylobacillus gramineus]
MKTKLSIALLSVLVFASAGAQAANIVQNGSFEADNIGNASWTFLNSVTGWHSSSVFEIQKGATQGGYNGFNTEAYDGIQYLELNSTSLTSVWQNLTTTAGSSYTLSFAFSGRPDTPNGLKSTFEVYWGDTKLINSSAKAKSDWVEYTFEDLVATGTNTQLKFVSLGPTAAPSYGSYLDGVTVIAAVPEPSTYGMLALGLGVIGFISTRKRKHNLA